MDFERYILPLFFRVLSHLAVSFLSKTQLIEHYEKTLGAFHFGGRVMIFDTVAALKLIDRYFKTS